MSTSIQDLKGVGGPGAAEKATRVAAPPPRWKMRILLPAIIFAVVILLIAVSAAESLLPSRPVRVVPVVVKTVEGSAGGAIVQAPGWLEPDPYPYFVTALAEGTVERVLVLEGERVEAGQVVAEIVDDDARLALARADAELAQRRAEEEMAVAELEAAELELEHLIARTRELAVAEARLAEIESEIETAQAEVALAEAQLLEIQDEYDRKAKLIDSNAVSEATVARLRLRLDAQQASLDAAEAQERVLAAKRAQAQADLAAARTNRELLIGERRAAAVARASLELARASVQLAEAARDEAALRFDRMQVRSPVSGIVMQRLASPGTDLMQGGVDMHARHIVHLYDPKRLQMRVDVPLADAALIGIGQEAEVTVEVLPDRIFKGQVSRIVHFADIQKNTVEVKVALDNPTEELKPEMLARAKFLATSGASDGAMRTRVFAPEALVQAGPDGAQFALVVTDRVEGRGKVARRSVTTGTRRLDGWIEIESGLNAGDLVIAETDPEIKPGRRVRIAGEAEVRGG